MKYDMQKDKRIGLDWAIPVSICWIFLPITPAVVVLQDRMFTGAGDHTNWSDPDNWDPADVPENVGVHHSNMRLLAREVSLLWRSSEISQPGIFATTSTTA